MPSRKQIAIQHYQAGNPDAAIAELRRQLAEDGQDGEAAFLLANVLESQADVSGAIQAYALATRLLPQSPAPQERLGDCYVRVGQTQDAVTAYQSALAIDEASHETWNKLGSQLHLVSQLELAARCFRQATQLAPHEARYASNLGGVERLLGQLDAALEHCQLAVQLDPDYEFGWNNLGNCQRDKGDLNGATQSFERVLQIAPSNTDALNNLGNVHRDAGMLHEALHCYQAAHEQSPWNPLYHSNLIYARQFESGVTLSSIRQLSEEWDEQQTAHLTARQQPRVHVAGRPLRVGFCSTGFCRHPVGYFTLTAFENFDHTQIQTFCYSDHQRADDLTDRFRSAASEFQDVRGLTDEQLTERIQRDKIDILVDMTGHLAGNRLLTFARKPAPIQMKWVGYAGSTGLKAIDYLIADRFHIPVEFDDSYREQIVRLSHAYVCYEPPDYAPPVAPSPAIKNGHITFGSCNQPIKYTVEVVQAWSRLLNEVPGSRLKLKYRGLDDPYVSNRIRQLFEQAGAPADAIEFEGGNSHNVFLGFLSSIDIALDPFPFSGGLTTCEALWCGVPVVTLPGETFASRHSLSYVSNVGHPEWAATTIDEYLAIAVDLAKDVPRLASIRCALREEMSQSSLCEAREFAKHFLNALGAAFNSGA